MPDVPPRLMFAYASPFDGQRPGELAIDWMVRIGLMQDRATALDKTSRLRFRIACRMLRAGDDRLAVDLPDQRSGESPIDWLTRHRLAPDEYTAVEMLIVANGWLRALDEAVHALIELGELGPVPTP